MKKKTNLNWTILRLAVFLPTCPTYQTKLNTVHDPLDGEAGDEDEDGQEHQAQVEAAGLHFEFSHL